MSSTYAILEISEAAYRDIFERLKEAASVD